MTEKTPKDIRRRQVAFNYKDPHQRALYDHSKKYTNFSAYIKSLIQRDMDTVK